MKILLLGEYSGVHNNLRKALIENGYEVLLLSDGDSYKSFDSDIFIKYKHIDSSNTIIKKIIKIYYLILAYSGFKGTIQIFKHIDSLRKLKGYDVVQLINPIFLSDFGSIVNFAVFLYLKNNNKKIFLCALGDDYFWVKLCLDRKIKYSFFNRMNIRTIGKYVYPIRYVYGLLYPQLNKYIAKNCNAVIPGLYDYYMAYESVPNRTSIVPIIIPYLNNDQKIQGGIKEKLSIFHGWQPGKDLRKGNDIFDKAIRRLLKKYPDLISYNIVGGVKYEDYIRSFNNSDIFIDQCYSYDRGVNALIGMQAGKVVLSGFESEVKEYYGVKKAPIINALPNEDSIYDQIEELIMKPEKVAEYKKSAKDFIKNYHNPEKILHMYFKIWNKY